MTLQKGILAFLFIAIAYIIKGLAGFGDPLISNPLLSLLFTTDQITPAQDMFSPLVNVGMVIKNRKQFNAKLTLPIVGFNVLGILPGVWILKKFGANVFMKLGLGLVIVYLGVRMLLNKADRPAKPNMVVCGIVSFISGITAGTYGINMIYLAYMERISASREEFRANSCFVFAVADCIRLVMYIVSGLYTRDVIILGLISLPASFLGLMIGGWIDKHINDAAAKSVIRYVFLLGGISTVIYAAIAIWGA